MRITTIVTFGIIVGLTVAAVKYGGEQLETIFSERNQPVPSIFPENSQNVARQRAAVVDVNGAAARERAIRDTQEQARQANYRAEAEQNAYQAQQQATYQSQLETQQAAAYQVQLQAQQQTAYQAQLQSQQQAAYQAQQAVNKAQPANQSAFGSGDASYTVIPTPQGALISKRPQQP